MYIYIYILERILMKRFVNKRDQYFSKDEKYGRGIKEERGSWIFFFSFFFGLQSQALALTHKASPPSRPSSVSSLPRSPQSHQSQQSQPQNATQLPPVHPHQSQTPLSTPQTPFSAHNQHPKQEANTSPKQEGFDLSKSTSSTGEFHLLFPFTQIKPEFRPIEANFFCNWIERFFFFFSFFLFRW